MGVGCHRGHFSVQCFEGFSPASFGLSEGPGPALEGPAQVLTDGLHQGRNEQVMCLIVFLKLYFKEK